MEIYVNKNSCQYFFGLCYLFLDFEARFDSARLDLTRLETVLVNSAQLDSHFENSARLELAKTWLGPCSNLDFLILLISNPFNSNSNQIILPPHILISQFHWFSTLLIQIQIILLPNILILQFCWFPTLSIQIYLFSHHTMTSSF